MVIQAAGRFTCTHRYIATATADGDRWLFVCEGCEHRTELLPLYRDALYGQLVAFPTPSAGADLGEAAFGHHSPSTLIQSA
jgi:hypothetical protein